MTDLRRYEIEEITEESGFTYQRRAHGEHGRNVSACEAEVALAAKDDTIAALRANNKALGDRHVDLFEQAARLRKALSNYVNLRPYACSSNCWCAHPDVGLIARLALEEKEILSMDEAIAARDAEISRLRSALTTIRWSGLHTLEEMCKQALETE